jgi:hypothetical protein
MRFKRFSYFMVASFFVGKPFGSGTPTICMTARRSARYGINAL